MNSNSSSSSRRVSSNNHNNNNNKPQQLRLTDYLRPVFHEATLIREYCRFAQIQQQQQELSGQDNNSNKALSGVYVIPSAQSIYTWFGLLTIPPLLTNNNNCAPPHPPSSTSSPYASAFFRFIIKFPHPDSSSSHHHHQQQHAHPTIYLSPVTISPTPKYLSTHPEVNSSTGQFNMRHIITANSSSATPSSSSSTTTSSYYNVYKLLKNFRKTFYKFESDDEAYLSKCQGEAAESVKNVGDVDTWLSQRFRSDRNLILLGAKDDNNHVVGGGGSGEEVIGDVVGAAGRNKVVGLSFLL